MSLTQKTTNLDIVNSSLREPLEVEDVQPKILVGSGEDCQVVLFAFNYKRIIRDEGK